MGAMCAVANCAYWDAVDIDSVGEASIDEVLLSELEKLVRDWQILT
jgi:hypothetical protein